MQNQNLKKNDRVCFLFINPIIMNQTHFQMKTFWHNFGCHKLLLTTGAIKE